MGGILWNTMPIFILLYRSIFLICYIVYVALLLRMANVVEDNPEPTLFDIIYPSETICADFCQGVLSVVNNLCTCLCNSIKNYILLLTDLPEIISVDNRVYYLQYSDSCTCDV